MNALSFARQPQTPPVARPHVHAPALQFSGELLNECRMTAMSCRTLGRANLFEACAMLSGDRATARTAYLETLIRCLPQATGRTPRFHRPGAGELTFDEAWLMRLFDSLSREDGASFDFLLRSRVDRFARRNLVFLLCRIAEQAGRRDVAV